MTCKKVRSKCLLSILFFLVTACVTVNIYFPAAEVRKAAEDIVKDVRGNEGKDNNVKPDIKNSPNSFLNISSVAYAANELTVSNATIRQLKDRIKERFPRLVPYMQMGAVGEAANGFLEIKDTSSLNLKQKAELKKLVSAENSDRKALYEAVAQSLNIPLSQVGKVQKIFASQWQQTAPSGTFIETSPGNWSRK